MGKTYASAFGLRDAMGDSENDSKNNTMKSNRILFIVHREQIAKQAKKSYKNVFGRSKTYEDACRFLNWEHNVVPLNIGGYKYDKTTKAFPIFINYDKSDDIQDTIKYEDHFTSRSSLM